MSESNFHDASFNHSILKDQESFDHMWATKLSLACLFIVESDQYITHTSHTKIRHTTINYAALGIWKRFFQFSGSLLIKRDTSSAIWHSDAL